MNEKQADAEAVGVIICALLYLRHRGRELLLQPRIRPTRSQQ
ncbi:hypothetical protein ABIB17_003763 [Arthrobacter sp. UYEF6]